ncbi:uncharacterized protein LOC103182372 [Callorhinchus milii]|uniref:uncharacterized protein LOC103182372 n=1 Tax=Callorhinchus milii TaxID=7868 RepID=UPI001C3FB502|nr:uncharacterized protein LOC103182372 [Callorhinchus milii]
MLDFRDLLVMRIDKSVYQVDCRSLPTADEDIEWGFLNNEGQVALQETMSEVSQDIVKDSIIQGAQLFELACVRMNEWTKQTLQELRNDSILQVQTIICHNLTTQLISEPFRDYGWTLQSNPRQAEGREYKQQLINYLQQVTLALQYLHSLRIIHCDLHCSYVFVNIVTNRVKLGRFGRAAYLQGTISDNMFNPHVYKVAPKNSLQRCPPEVEQLGKYSRASDIFMLADLISDALIPEKWVHGAISPLQIDQQLLDCLEKCRSQNPSRRLKIDSILTALQDFKIRSLMKCDLPFPIPVQLHSTSDKTYVEGEVDQFLPPSNSHYMSIMHDSEEEEDLYYSIAYNPDYMNDSVQPQVGDESVYQCHQPYSEDIYEDINCRWEKVVTEYRNENRLISPDSDSQPPSFTPLCGYQDVGIDRKNRPK